VTALVMMVALVCGAALQAVLPTWRGVGEATAPVLMGVVLYYALTHGRPIMLAAAIVAGLLQDSLGLVPLGYSSFCFCAAGLAARKFREVIFPREIVTHMLFGALVSGEATLGLFLLLRKDGLVALRPAWVAVKVLGAMILGMVIVPLEFRLLGSMDRMLGNVPWRGR